VSLNIVLCDFCILGDLYLIVRVGWCVGDCSIGSCYFANESEAPLRYGLDVFAFSGIIAKRFAQRVNSHIQIALLDDRVRPHVRDDLLFSEQVAAITDEERQRLKRLWRQRYRTVIAKQDVFRWIEAEGSELIAFLNLQAEKPSRKKSLRVIKGNLRLP